MPDETRKKKRLGCFKIVLCFFLAIALLIVVWLPFNLGPVPVPGQALVEVSKETTRITEPLDENGDVDFLEAINLRCSQGVTLENNSFVKLIQASGPLPNSQTISDAVTQRLGIAPVPEKGHYLLSFKSWVEQEVNRINSQRDAQRAAEIDQIMEVDSESDATGNSELKLPEPPKRLTAHDYDLQQLDFASQYPWSAKELPQVEQWRKANEAPLKIARKGIARSEYYYPLVSDRFPKMLNANLGYTKAFSDIGKCLQVSSMNRLHQEDVDGCIQDIKALHRLGIHVSRGPTMIEELVSHKLINEAMDSLVSLCASEKASLNQLKALFQWIKEFEIPADLGQRVELDRYVGLDATISMARARNFETEEVEGYLGMYSRIIDWPTVLEQLNTDYDRFVEVGEIKDATECASAWSALQKDMVANQNWVTDNGMKSALMGRKSKGIWVGRLLSGILMPDVKIAADSENGIKAKRDILGLIIAAAMFKTENSRYPNSIDELLPQYLSEKPINPFTGQPFVYRLTESGIQIQPQEKSDHSSSLRQNDRLTVLVEQHTWKTFRQEQDESDSIRPKRLGQTPD